MARNIIISANNYASEAINNVETLCNDVAGFMDNSFKVAFDDEMMYRLRKFATGIILSEYIISATRYQNDSNDLKGSKRVSEKSIMLDMILELTRAQSQLCGCPDECEFEYGEKPSPSMNRNIAFSLLEEWIVQKGM